MSILDTFSRLLRRSAPVEKPQPAIERVREAVEEGHLRAMGVFLERQIAKNVRHGVTLVSSLMDGFPRATEKEIVQVMGEHGYQMKPVSTARRVRMQSVACIVDIQGCLYLIDWSLPAEHRPTPDEIMQEVPQVILPGTNIDTARHDGTRPIRRPS